MSDSEGDDSYGPVPLPNTEKSNDTIGPSLPPYLLKNRSDRLSPTQLTIGPSLPPHLLKVQSANTKESEITSDTNQVISPTLRNPSTEFFGPALPPHLQERQVQVDSDDDSFGPLPPNRLPQSSAHIALEERALQIKMGQLGPKDDRPEREEWMIELPNVGGASKLGLGPRQFRKKAAPDMSDRTLWTDTPQLKEQRASGKCVEKVDVKKEAEERLILKRNQEQADIVIEHNKKKKRDKSLLKIHQERLKEDKQKEEPVARRPFSREIDLQVNRFDDAQKKAIMKKAAHLDDRFSSGKSQYL